MNRIIAVSTVIGCKNFCNYCPQDEVIKAYSHISKTNIMSFETFQTCIDKLPEDIIINFAGFSEPCLNPDYVRMILYANKQKHKVNIFTTLIGMKLSDIDQLENVPFLRFLVHLPDNQNKTIIAVNNEFLEVIEKLINSKINVEWKFHQSPLSNEDIHPSLKPLLIKNNIYNSLVKAELKTRAGNIAIEGKSSPTKIMGKIKGCHLLYYNQLLPNGDVFICCMDWELKYFLGSLIYNDYDSLFKSKTFKNILTGFKNNDSEILCRSCELCQKQDPFSKRLKRKIISGIIYLDHKGA